MRTLRLQQIDGSDGLALGFSHSGTKPELLVLVCGWQGHLFRQAFAGYRMDTGSGRWGIDEMLGDTGAGGLAVSVGRGAERYAAGLARWPLWLHAVDDAEGYVHGPPGPGARPLLTPDPLLAVHDLTGVLEGRSRRLRGADLVHVLGEDPGGVLHRRAKTFSGIDELAKQLGQPAPPGLGVTATAVLVLQGLARHARPEQIEALATVVRGAVEPVDGIRAFVPAGNIAHLPGSSGQYGASLYLACGTVLPGWESPPTPRAVRGSSSGGRKTEGQSA